MPMWPGCQHFGQYDCAMTASDAEPLLDKNATEWLRNDLPDNFQCVGVPGDGNCLTHAISKSVIGVELLYHGLRLEMQTELRDNMGWYKDHVYPFFDDEMAKEVFTQAADQAVPKEDSTDGNWQMAEFLGTVHMHAIANILQRPVVLLSEKSTWERALAGVYLPARNGITQYDEAHQESILNACKILQQQLTEQTGVAAAPGEGSGILKATMEKRRSEEQIPMLEAWVEKLSAVGYAVSDLGAHESSRELGALGDELRSTFSDDERVQAVLEAIALARIKTPIYIAWSGPMLNHYCSVMPVIDENGQVPPEFDKSLIPNRDGEMVVYGYQDAPAGEEESFDFASNNEEIANQYLEGGVWGVRGNNWPNKKKFQDAISQHWQEANPDKSLQDESIEQGWGVLLPNLYNQVFDVAELFKALNVDDNDDELPVFLHVHGGAKVLIPAKMAQMAKRLPGMYELLGNAADRMRPIWITHPDASSVLTAGEKYTIKWGTSPRIAAMMEKKGVKMEDQVVEIGWVPAGHSNFRANICASTPFNTLEHEWDVPMNFRPGGYWLAVRLLPFEPPSGLAIEGAGPTGGSFNVVANPDAPVDESLAAEDGDGSYQWTMTQGPNNVPVPANIALMLEKCHQTGLPKIFSIQTSAGNVQFIADVQQMKLTPIAGGFSSIALQRNGQGVAEFQPDPQALASLIEMTCMSEARCTEALKVTQNHLEMAMNWLFDQPPEDPAPEPAPAPVAIDTSLIKEVSPADEANQIWGRLRDTVGVAALTADALKNWAAEDMTIKVIDPSQLSVLEVQPDAAADGMLDNMISEEYIQSMEEEAARWQTRWNDIHQTAAPQAPSGLARASSTNPSSSTETLPRASGLSRLASAPAAMTGLNKKAWGSLMSQLNVLTAK